MTAGEAIALLSELDPDTPLFITEGYIGRSRLFSPAELTRYRLIKRASGHHERETSSEEGKGFEAVVVEVVIPF